MLIERDISTISTKATQAPQPHPTTTIFFFNCIDSVSHILMAPGVRWLRSRSLRSRLVCLWQGCGGCVTKVRSAVFVSSAISPARLCACVPSGVLRGGVLLPWGPHCGRVPVPTFLLIPVVSHRGIAGQCNTGQHQVGRRTEDGAQQSSTRPEQDRRPSRAERCC